MESFIGQIMHVGFNFAPYGWSTCQGQTMQINQNAALFGVLGITFGGDGRNTFMLPNAQSRVLVGAGQGQGLSSYSPGEMGGNEQVALTSAQMPQHIHTIAAAGTLAAVNNNAPGVSVETPADGSMLGVPYDSDNATITIYVPAGTSGSTTVNLGGVQLNGTTGVAGGSQPVGTLPPFLAVTTLICTAGIYPTRQ